MHNRVYVVILCKLLLLQIYTSLLTSTVKKYSNLELSQAVRPLGSYEKLLSRIEPCSGIQSISHGCVFILSGCIKDSNLKQAIQRCCIIHPMLKVYVGLIDSKQYWFECSQSPTEISEIVIQTEQCSDEDFDKSWQMAHDECLNAAKFSSVGPQWRLKNIQSLSTKRSALVFTFNHGIDDQQSVGILMKDLLIECNNIQNNFEFNRKSKAFPNSIEKSITSNFPSIRTMLWALYQIKNSLVNPKLIPNRVEKELKTNDHSFITNPDLRRTFLRYFKLNNEETERLIKACKSQDVTVTHLLSSAMLIMSQHALGEFNESESNDHDQNLRFLLSVGLRPYGLDNVEDFTDGTVACAGGAVDFIVPMNSVHLSKFSKLWEVAKVCKQKSLQIIRDYQFVPESVRLFDYGMRSPLDILKAVNMDASSQKSLGRGFTCGVSNIGVVTFPKIMANSETGQSEVKIEEGYYGTSHSRNGVLYQLSTMTVKCDIENDTKKNLFGYLCGCLQFTSPLVNDNEADTFRDKLEKILRNIQ